jgi:hypothetical protein
MARATSMAQRRQRSNRDAPRVRRVAHSRQRVVFRATHKFATFPVHIKSSNPEAVIAPTASARYSPRNSSTTRHTVTSNTRPLDSVRLNPLLTASRVTPGLSRRRAVTSQHPCAWRMRDGSKKATADTLRWARSGNRKSSGNRATIRTVRPLLSNNSVPTAVRSGESVLEPDVVRATKIGSCAADADRFAARAGGAASPSRLKKFGVTR